MTRSGAPSRRVDGNAKAAVSVAKDGADPTEGDGFGPASTDGGEPGPSAWRRDGVGVSWRVVPRALADLPRDADRERSGRVTRRMPRMGKLDVADPRATTDAA